MSLPDFIHLSFKIVITLLIGAAFVQATIPREPEVELTFFHKLAICYCAGTLLSAVFFILLLVWSS